MEYAERRSPNFTYSYINVLEKAFYRYMGHNYDCKVQL